MRQVRFDIVGGASCPTDCEEEGVGYAAISDAECAGVGYCAAVWQSAYRQEDRTEERKEVL